MVKRKPRDSSSCIGKDDDDLALELKWNQKNLEHDLRNGMRQLLELHNSEELRTLGVALELEGVMMGDL